MPNIEIVVVLLAAIIALAVLAQRLDVPYPIVFVLGGLALGFLPFLPEVALEPDLLLLLFLPPLLYGDAWFTSWRDFKANRRPIGLLAIGLVIVTTLLVAVVAHAVFPAMPWASAFVLGAIVSPTDAVAASAIAQRVGLPRRTIVILDGESLVNDATGLVAYRFAVVAVVTGAFSLAEAGLRFVVVVVGGIAIGLAVAWLSKHVERHLGDPTVEIAFSFLTPFLAYVPADALGVSGVLAVVAAGLYNGRRSPRSLSAQTRIQALAVWSMLTFLLNGLIFLLIGLQLRSIVGELVLEHISFWSLLGDALVICLAVIVIRFLWVFPATYLPRVFSRKLRERDPSPPWRAVVIISWTGMRGGVSLAAALALPFFTANGADFPARGPIIFFTFAVILATLVGQGLSLPWLIRKLGVADDGAAEREENRARLVAAQAALTRLDELESDGWAGDMTLVHARKLHQHRVHRYDDDGDGDEAARDVERDTNSRRLQFEVLHAQRSAVIGLRDTGEIDDEVLHRLEREIDLQETWLDV